jgi:hypothetical protein
LEHGISRQRLECGDFNTALRRTKIFICSMAHRARESGVSKFHVRPLQSQIVLDKAESQNKVQLMEKFVPYAAAELYC